MTALRQQPLTRPRKMRKRSSSPGWRPLPDYPGTLSGKWRSPSPSVVFHGRSRPEANAKWWAVADFSRRRREMLGVRPGIPETPGCGVSSLLPHPDSASIEENGLLGPSWFVQLGLDHEIFLEPGWGSRAADEPLCWGRGSKLIQLK